MINVSIGPEFRRPITLRRYGVGSYVDGHWVDAVPTDTEISASVQPLNAGDYRVLPEGSSSQRGWKVWFNGDFQFGTDDSLRPDEILVDGIWFKLVHKEAWKANGYSAASFIEIK